MKWENNGILAVSPRRADVTVGCRAGENVAIQIAYWRNVVLIGVNHARTSLIIIFSLAYRLAGSAAWNGEPRDAHLTTELCGRWGQNTEWRGGTERRRLM